MLRATKLAITCGSSNSFFGCWLGASVMLEGIYIGVMILRGSSAAVNQQSGDQFILQYVT